MRDTGQTLLWLTCFVYIRSCSSEQNLSKLAWMYEGHSNMQQVLVRSKTKVKLDLY